MAMLRSLVLMVRWLLAGLLGRLSWMLSKRRAGGRGLACLGGSGEKSLLILEMAALPPLAKGRGSAGIGVGDGVCLLPRSAEDQAVCWKANGSIRMLLSIKTGCCAVSRS
jgi:hypothetical protein